MNRRAKFDAASFILGREIRNRKTNKQTVSDISTPCLSACVDNNGNCWRNNHFMAIRPVLAGTHLITNVVELTPTDNSW